MPRLTPQPPPLPERPHRLDPSSLRTVLRIGFLSRYLSDESFCEALRRLSVGDDFAQFCQKWHLTFDDDQVQSAISQWCETSHELGGLAVGDVIEFFGSAVEHPDARRTTTITIFWNPTFESQKSAQSRIRKSIDRKIPALLKSIDDEFAKRYEIYPRQRSRLRGKYLDFLFIRQCSGKSFAAIHKAHADKHMRMIGSKAVERACRRLAEDMGLVLFNKARRSERSKEQTQG